MADETKQPDPAVPAPAPEPMKPDAKSKPVEAATKLADVPPTPPPSVTTMPEVVPEPEPDTAKARLRAFEDEHLGKDAVRIKGEIERGVGSPWAAMKPETKRQYEALERVIATEQKVADAKAALLAAESDHAEAVAATEPKPDAAPVE